MRALWGICLALFLLPGMIEFAPFLRITPLHGEESRTWEPLKNGSIWIKDRPQEALSELMDTNFPLRAPLIRFRNQLDYWLFGETHAREVVVGKEGTLFHKASIGNKVGPEAMQKTILQRTEKISRFRDTLDSYHIGFRIIIAPGKRTANRSQLPVNAPSFHASQKVMEALEQAQIPVIDLPRYFARNPLPDSIPMYPKLGLHWTPYASALALQQTMGSIPGLDTSLKIEIANPEQSARAGDQELDLWNMLNLIFPFETWPVHRGEVRVKGAPLPKRLLVIGDSFFIEWMDEGWIFKCFEEVELLFYGRFIYEGDVSKGSIYTEDLNLMEYLRGFDEVWMMAHEDNLPAFPFGFEQHIARLN